MNNHELIDKINEAIVKMNEKTIIGVIKQHTIDSVCNWKTGEETGLAAVLKCGTQFEYTEDVLNRWKEQLGADEYRIKVNRSQLYITFIVPYKKQA
jgi:hypothetical protein